MGNKKNLIILFSCLIGLISLQTKDDTLKATFTPNEEKKKTLLGGIEFNYVTATTTHTGKSAGSQKINIFTLPASKMNGNAKLVTWAKQKDSIYYQRLPLLTMAQDYENTHPGWKVVAGINADQYYPKYGGQKGVDGSYYYVPQPYYPLIIDYERRFAISPYKTTVQMVGFLNDGSKISFLDVGTGALKYFGIQTPSGAVIKVDSFNTANTAGTVVWSTYISSSEKAITPVKATVNQGKILYVIEAPVFAYMYNSKNYPDGIDAFFGKGKITKAIIGPNTVELVNGQFAIETSSSSTYTVGNNVVVQAYYQDERLNKVEAGSGYHSVQRLSGKDIGNNSSYNTNRYNRSLFGRKADGSYVLITADKGNGAAGIDWVETNAMLKHYGIEDCYQDDGGGSVTAIYRDESGKLVLNNTPSDGSQRSVLSGLFFVVKA